MTEKELQQGIAETRSAGKEASKSKESARAFVGKAGIITKSGKLARPYRRGKAENS